MKKTTIELTFFGKLCLWVGFFAVMFCMVCGVGLGLPKAAEVASEYHAQQVKEQQKQERVEKIKETVFFWKD